VALGKDLENLERPKAKARQENPGAGRGRPKIASSNLDKATGNGRTDEKVASALGMGKDTYRKARAVVEAAVADATIGLAIGLDPIQEIGDILDCVRVR
jgi:hypothetical protein